MLIGVTVPLWTAKNVTSWHLPFWERDPLRKSGNCCSVCVTQVCLRERCRVKLISVTTRMYGKETKAFGGSMPPPVLFHLAQQFKNKDLGSFTFSLCYHSLIASRLDD